MKQTPSGLLLGCKDGGQVQGEEVLGLADVDGGVASDWERAGDQRLCA
jgi:hypothetical protein